MINHLYMVKPPWKSQRSRVRGDSGSVTTPTCTTNALYPEVLILGTVYMSFFHILYYVINWFLWVQWVGRRCSNPREGMMGNSINSWSVKSTSNNLRRVIGSWSDRKQSCGSEPSTNLWHLILSLGRLHQNEFKWKDIQLVSEKCLKCREP